LKKKEFPGIQQAADKASDKAQKFYINLVRLNLVVGVLAALITIFNFESEQPKLYVYCISLGLLLISLGLTVSIKYFKFEDLWYQGRALAESVKTLTWRYITCSENYEANLLQNEAEKFFTDSLQVLQTKFPELIKFMDTNLLQRSAITNEMNNVRNITWQLRLEKYVECRIEDQINWYSSKAKYNKTKKALWLWIVISAQALSIISCTSLIIWTSSSWNLVGLFTTVAASGIAWLEVRQYQSLIQAYATATMELVLIKSLSNSILTEVDFTKYVLDSENAISREHTMWLAQRRK
jgi:energy-coupling factor transporter transmembrane protein EcfT